MRIFLSLLGAGLCAVACSLSVQGSGGGAGTGGSGAGGDGGAPAAGGGDGDGVMGGDGDGDGAEPEPECTTSSECPEADSCNEAATCEEGKCVPGASKCGDFDTGNCACVEVEGACIVQGADADDDGEKSAYCEAAPGEDCDDSKDTVHPGAEESCDGLDNDCDGLLDLDEGLDPFERTVDITGAADGFALTPLAWSTAANQYGVAWPAETPMSGGPRLDVRFGLIDLDGSFDETLAPAIVGTQSATFHQIALGYGHDEFGLAAVDSGPDGNAIIHFRRIAPTGTATVGPVRTFEAAGSFPLDLQVVRPSPNDWLVLYSHNDSGTVTNYVTRITEGDVAAADVNDVLTPEEEAFASEEATLAAYHTGVSSTNYYWTAFTEMTTDPVARGTFDTEASQFGVVVSTSGPAVAFAERDTVESEVRFRSVRAQSYVCDGVTLSDPSGPLEGLVKVPDGWVVVSSIVPYNPSTELRFSRVFEDCSTSVGVGAQELGTPAYMGSPPVGNGKGLAISWTPADDGTVRRVALFGPNVCDDPDQ